ncbi:tripartite tricarboxylate transporter substrate binding protein [Cupriavidus basilensis]|uniref:Tripartite tricarboxylate transporter substrate binding protein n=1 Tax=Cupriavidus basilensis TaxID=68895 RepID=A0ABT6AVE7_9BURK|nr:tripartite tricarboxylate transporter substrate binding protein [Cupriavidus basilensis]MDF3836595.1 tripartite tricarboxylate transporter substrate binding protein [Cupriavidus basilensis]
MRFPVRLCATALCWLAAGSSGLAHAEAWPAAKPIRLVVTYAPGGGADTMARMISPRLGQELGQTIVVDNRPGAGGQIGTDLVAKSAPDGYTVLLDAASFASNPSLYKKLPYDPVKSFIPVSVLAPYPNMLVVNPQFPARSVQELIAMARAKPGGIAYASSGNGSAQHLAGALFAQRMKLDLLHVPYKGGGPAMADVIAGQVPVFFANTASGLQHVRAGKLRALAVTGAKRTPILPDTPTLAEAGVPRYEVYEWNGVFLPAGTPPDIVKRLSEAIRKVINLPENRERVTSLGGEIVAGTPAEAAKFIQAQTSEWAKVIKDGNIQVD